MSRLSVWWEGQIVGTLFRDADGDLGFFYSSDWLAQPAARAISTALPLRIEPYGRRQTRSFFAGLLPEEGQRDAAASALGLSRNNDFALLDALGGDVAGALAIWPEGQAAPVYQPASEPEPLTESALATILDSLPLRPLLAGQAGLRLSLAGAQNKVPVVVRDNQICLPSPGQPTTHILKPEMTRFAGSVENEAFVMRLAKAIGLSVAPVDPRVVQGRKFLLIERYDRQLGPDGSMHRVHQEDFCQALGHQPESKYAAEGGPTFKTSFSLVRSVTTRPAIEVLKLLDATIFNLIIGNADAHGKNFSLLYSPSDGTVLAPLYDLLCTMAWPHVATRMAMKIGGAGALEELSPRAWEKFSEDAGLRMPFVRKRVLELCQLVAGALHDTEKDLEDRDHSGGTVRSLGAIIAKRAAGVASVSAPKTA